MAPLRSRAIGALRLAGHTDITEAIRWASRSMDRPSTILGRLPAQPGEFTFPG